MRFKIFMLLVLCGFFISCKDINLYPVLNNTFKIDERAKFRDIDFTDPCSSSENYSVIAITDIHFSRTKKDEFLTKLKDLDFTDYGPPAMILALGDISDGGTHSQYKEYNDFVDEIENILHIKVFPVPGNHDTYDTGAYGKNYIEDVFPTTFYRIKFRNISYYFLDSADGTFGYKQLNSLENLFISDSNKKIICTHYPLYADTLYYRLSNYKEKAHLINLLSNNDVILYLSGHTHIFLEHNFGSFKEYVCGNLVGDDEEPSFLILSFNKKGEYRNTRIEL
jgi:predicted MPP superfamily phosphohydrolase